MIEIKKLSKAIKKQICAAEECARMALDYKEGDKALADTYYTAANQHLQIMNSFHDQVVRLITDYRKEKGEPPAMMQAWYDYVHEEQIESTREVKVLLEMYKS